jgi:hypothetical protein
VLNRLVLALTLGLALFALPRSAHADAKTEAAAKALESKAMQEDYLATDFDKALDKLNQAATKCGEKCSSLVRAQIHRDIGVVHIAKQNKDAGIAAFIDAIKLDANVQLDADTKTKEVEAAWAEAKKQAGSGAAAAPPAGGDFTLQPMAETTSHTPLDVYAEYGGTEQLAKVVLKYKGFGMPDWKTLEMKSMGDSGKGWGAEIPCADVGEGDVIYYLQGFNAANDPVATAGDRNAPYHTKASRAFAGAVPHFPGKDPPKACAEAAAAADCPPDFPGCKKPAEGENSNLKDEGQDCEEDGECKSGTCGADKKCQGGGEEEKPKSKRKKIWIGVAFDYDIVAIPGGSDVCLLAQSTAPVASANGYYCTVNGQDFPSRASNAGQEDLNIVPGDSDKVSGGFAPGNFRFLASLDYAASSNMMVGVRLGYVGNTYNGQSASAFPPLHAELRGTLVLGKDPFEKAGVAPYVMVGAGLAQYSAAVGTTVISKIPSNYTGPMPPANCTSGATGCTNAQAWSVSGPGFVGIGAGLRLAFVANVALLIGPRFNIAFGGSGTLISLSPEIGLQTGF